MLSYGIPFEATQNINIDTSGLHERFSCMEWDLGRAFSLWIDISNSGVVCQSKIWIDSAYGWEGRLSLAFGWRTIDLKDKSLTIYECHGEFCVCILFNYYL